ncbi:MAG: YggT family protein [Dehalococcoidales bacterium]
MGFLFDLLGYFLEVLTLIILARVFISWVSPGQSNTVTNILYLVTEPILAPLRRVLPKYGRLDFSPMAAVIILRIVISFIP